MTLPSFVVIGASRSGTTSLHHYLSQHPQVHMCARKSPNYFAAHEAQPPWETKTALAMAKQWVRSRPAYEALFANRRPEHVAVGEVSPVYLQAQGVAARLHGACPDAKLVAILRNPIDRAYAHYLGRRRDGIETRESFATVVEEELARGLPDQVAFGSYLGASRYAHYLSSYDALFPASQLHLCLFDDLKSDAAGVLRDLFTYLEVDPAFLPDMSDCYNQSGQIRQPLVRAVWTRSVRLRTALRPLLPKAIRDLARPLLKELTRPPLPLEQRLQLCELFRDEVGALEDRLDRSLAGWLEAPTA